MQNKSLILICGKPAAGKSTLARRLASLLPNYRLIHTDDYGFGDGASKEALIDIVQASKTKSLIIEGVLIPRILRKAIALGVDLVPDIIIWLDADDETIMSRYATDPARASKKVANALTLGRVTENQFIEQVNACRDMYAFIPKQESWGYTLTRHQTLSAATKSALKAINRVMSLAASLQGVAA